MVMALDGQPSLFHGEHHLGAQILVVVCGRNGEVTFLVTRPVTEVVFFTAGIPTAFLGIDKIEAVLLRLVKAHVVENEEFGFGAEVSRVRDAGEGEIRFSFLRNVARVLQVVLLGDRIGSIANQDQRGNIGERIEHGGCRVWYQQHVTLVNGCPASNAGPVHAESFFERGFIQLMYRKRNVMPQPGQVGKSHINHFHVIRLGKFKNFLRFHRTSIYRNSASLQTPAGNLNFK
jgi:hypothetical protein